MPVQAGPVIRHLGHVELITANNGPLMVLRHTARCQKDREKLERFSHSRLALFLAPQSEILEQVTGDAPWYSVKRTTTTFSRLDFIGLMTASISE